MSRHSRMNRGLLPIRRVVAGTVSLASVILVSAPPAHADGMPEPTVAPKRHVVHHVHRHRYGGVHRAERPVIGYEVKHVHEDLGAVVYVQPAWPACRYVLDSAFVKTVRDSYTGHFDCGS